MWYRKEIFSNKVYRDFNFRIIYGGITNDHIWIRLGLINKGIRIRKTPLMFSERMGIRKCLPLPFGWRGDILID